MNYQTAFSIAQTGYDGWPFTTISAAFLLVSTLILVMRQRSTASVGKRKPVAAWKIWLSFLMSFVVCVAGSYMIWHTQQELRTALTDGNASIVEGPVTHFVPIPENSSGRDNESFCVQQTCFHYRENIITGGFNLTARNGGPIHEGLPVRITYVGDIILKLEIATP